MANDAAVKLISQLDEKNEEAKTIYAIVESIGHREFFAAAQSGFKPDCKLTVWTSEYDGQSIVLLGGRRYSVYRTYDRADERTELYLTSKAGI